MIPISNRIIIRPKPAETKTGAGIYIPDVAQEKSLTGTVIAVGPGKYSDSTGVIIPMQTKIGDTVKYSKHVGYEVQHDGENLIIMIETDVFMII